VSDWGLRTKWCGFRLGFVAYVRTVTTGSGATAVQIVWKSVYGSRDIEHVGSAHSPAEVEVLKASAAQRIAAGQDPLPLDQPVEDGPRIQVVGMRMGLLLDAIARVYRRMGLDQAAGDDVVFEQLVTARIIEPSSKLDAARVLEEAGVGPACLVPDAETLAACLRRTSVPSPPFRAVSARSDLGPAALDSYDVTSLLCRRRHNNVVTS